MTPTHHSLSTNRRRLIDICSRLGFGRIERLAIIGGEPSFNPPPILITEVKLGIDGLVRDGIGNFYLKPVVIDLMRVIDLIENGSIRCLEVRHGLPFRIEIEGELAA